MAFRREWFPSDTIKLINRSEDFLVRGGRLQTPASAGEQSKNGAHGIGRHLLASGPGALGKGVSTADFRDRFLNAADKVSSVWLGKGDMTILLCELLNSRIGQAALRKLDLGVHRVVIHYLNQKAMAHLTGSVSMQQSTIQVTPARKILTDFKIFNKHNGEYIKTIKKPSTIPEVRRGIVKDVEIGMVHAVLDRHSAGLHIQTLFPSSEMAESSMDWSIGRMSMRGAYIGDTLIERALPPQ